MPRSFNEWDSASLYELRRSGHRFFGNNNIGNLNLTSMQVAGMLVPSDDVPIVTHWYARVSLAEHSGYRREEIERLMERHAQHSTVLWRINDRNIWKASLADLFWHRTGLDRAAPRAYWPEVIPRRSLIGAETWGNSSRDPTQLQDLDDEFLMSSRLWIHLCGLRLVDNESETDADSIDKVMAALTKAGGERASVEQRIVDWVMGTAKQSDDPEASAQLMAVADGIMEGRHR